jgi:hypothetical protein
VYRNTVKNWWSFNFLDCSEYTFEVKLFAPGSKEVGKLSNIRLPPLADIPGYVPPPLTSVMSITFNPQGEKAKDHSWSI